MPACFYSPEQCSVLLIKELLSGLKLAGGANSCVWFSSCSLAMIFISFVFLLRQRKYFVQFKVNCLDTRSSASLFSLMHLLLNICFCGSDSEQSSNLNEAVLIARDSIFMLVSLMMF